MQQNESSESTVSPPVTTPEIPKAKVTFEYLPGTDGTDTFVVPALGSVALKSQDALCRVKYATGTWNVKIFRNERGQEIGMEYVRMGSVRPAVDLEFSREAYRMRDEGITGLASSGIDSAKGRIFEDLLAYIWPDEVTFLKMAAVRLKQPAGDDRYMEVERIVVVVYAHGALPPASTAAGNAARYVYDLGGELLMIDNVMGGE